MPKNNGRRRKRAKSSRPTTTPTAKAPAHSSAGDETRDDADLLAGLEAVITQLGEAAQAVRQYQSDPDALFDLDELATHLEGAGFATAEHLDKLLMAAELVHREAPLATTYGTGSVWAGRQRPRYVLRLAELAERAEHTITYLERLSDDATTRATSRPCPDVTAAGTPCGGVRVRTAGGTRGRACWNHLTEKERAEIRIERKAAVIARACPACRAPAGQACVDQYRLTPAIHGPRLHPGVPLPADWPRTH